VFRRRQPAEVAPSSDAAGSTDPAGKGRSTPTRREAETARKERVKPPLDRRAAARAERAAAAADRAKGRSGQATGNQRFMLARDRGPVRAFVRDYVDARLTAGQYLMPAIVVFLVISIALSHPSLVGIRYYAIVAFYVFVIYVAIDTILLTARIKRIAAERFPNESTQGVGFYGAMRALQIRRLRQPKPTFKRGQQPTAR
jgi:Protein of unknown function (DUF3043)